MTKQLLTPQDKEIAGSTEVLLCMFGGLPEPPTLNAILVMKTWFRSVTFLRNNLTMSRQNLIEEPQMVEVGVACETRVAMRRGPLWKLARFVRYCLALREQLRTGRFSLVVIHDYLALLAYHCMAWSAPRRPLVWFNSYDVIDTQAAPPGRFSLMRQVLRRHEALFAEVDFFTLPAEERIKHYPVQHVRQATQVVPNFPALGFYQRFQKARRMEGQELRLIYQGALGRGHGFEQIIPMLQEKIGGRSLHLVLKGWIEPEYERELRDLATRCDVVERLQFAGFGPYREVPALAASCDVGLALFTGQDIMNQTLGTASNKIYEYAALGLPVLLFDTEHFRHHLGSRDWAFFTDLSEPSLRGAFHEILARYELASQAAMRDFAQEFNFERRFVPVLEQVVQQLSQHHG